MIRTIQRTALVAAMCTLPLAARAQSSISLSLAGGATAGVGNLYDTTDLGYNVAAGLNFGARNPIGVRAEIGYNGLGFKNTSTQLRILTGTANLVYNLATTGDAPYLIGGVGAYNTRLANGSISTDNTVAGINVGGGLRFQLSGLSTFFEARYNKMLGNGTGYTDGQFIPITFGIMF